MYLYLFTYHHLSVVSYNTELGEPSSRVRHHKIVYVDDMPGVCFIISSIINSTKSSSASKLVLLSVHSFMLMHDSLLYHYGCRIGLVDGAA